MKVAEENESVMGTSRLPISPSKVEPFQKQNEIQLAPSTRQIIGQPPVCNRDIVDTKEKKLKAIINFLTFRQRLQKKLIKREKSVSSELIRSSQFYYM